ncbi:hypothetical protein [Thermomonas sp.]|uniref:hypothetical protein n=1 Tax=Thermomonas sp. TaxID=1971895 RepID=UPI00260E1926|nr:hypothetical protein [Thermomonas sp.]MBL0227055.1 hypothetical protein [Thermomonas sp.]
MLSRTFDGTAALGTHGPAFPIAALLAGGLAIAGLADALRRCLRPAPCSQRLRRSAPPQVQLPGDALAAAIIPSAGGQAAAGDADTIALVGLWPLRECRLALFRACPRQRHPWLHGGVLGLAGLLSCC